MNGLADPTRVDADAIRFEYVGATRMTAGTLDRWTLRFVALRDLPAGARIGVAHRWPCDWGIAQASDPQGVDYLEVVVAGGKSVRWWNARLHAWHPFDHIVFVEMSDGLTKGQTMEMRYGEARYGSPGFRVQTFIEEGSPFSLRWQRNDGGAWVEFARHVIAVDGAAPHVLVVTAPSRVAARESFNVHLRIEDRWGNPAALDKAVTVEITDAIDASQTSGVTLPACAWTTISMSLGGAGMHRLHAKSTLSLEATSNPIDVQHEPPAPRIYWGDLHGQSVIGCGARSIDAYYSHARDFAGVDVASHQANCFLVSREEWRETEASTSHHHEPGRFITYLGVEWSGASNVGGDHNLYFPADAAPLHRCSHEFIADKSDVATDLAHVEDVYRHYRSSDTLIAVHVGGRTADLRWHSPDLDRLIEVHSTHATSEWFLFDALRRGYRMGVIAGSDGVDGRPGNSHPGHMGVRNVRGGLTAIIAPRLTRDALWEALRQRHCYATTGERIALAFRCGDASMGDAIGHRTAPFTARVEGTAPLECIEFFRDTECVRSIDLFEDALASPNRLRVAWRGASAPGNWQRARMTWNGELRIEGGRIERVEGFAFDTPDEGVVEHTSHRVRWKSVTAGDWDGVVLTLDRSSDAELAFVTEPMNLRTRLADVGSAGRRFGAHQPERCVELRWLPVRAPSHAFNGSFDDSKPPPGEHAYWLRVRQSDGAYAWTSPIFVASG
ncbi:MAG TPA: DUF3604 domain-containing protein [Casimicrobiaceae bacterium]|nr:DUF3604 domain-containing protein [Casimicrobiaceae bacterium]